METTRSKGVQHTRSFRVADTHLRKNEGDVALQQGQTVVEHDGGSVDDCSIELKSAVKTRRVR
jgi:hypothetical protein